jgi:hypothetical protein
VPDSHVILHARELVERHVEAEQFEPAPHQLVTDLERLGHDVDGRLVDADIVAQGFRHLVDAVQSLEQRHGQYALRRLPMVLLQLPPHQQIELLVGAAQFDIGLQRNRVITLHQRVEELVDRDRLVAMVALGKVIALEHACHGVRCGEANHVDRRHPIHPRRVEHHLGAAAIEDAEYLFGVGFGITRDCSRVSGGRVAFLPVGSPIMPVKSPIRNST